MKQSSCVPHDFYCIRCGKKGIPLMRKAGHQRERNHRKVLYCPYCRMEVNHLEITNYEDLIQFKEDFAAGKYIQEAEESVEYVKTIRHPIYA